MVGNFRVQKLLIRNRKLHNDARIVWSSFAIEYLSTVFENHYKKDLTLYNITSLDSTFKKIFEFSRLEVFDVW